MSKIGVVVCGNSGIDYIKHDYDIPVLRSMLLMGGEEYEDFTGIKADEFYKRLEENPDLHPSTAQTSTGKILETYEMMRDKGYDELVVITISSKLSGTNEGAQLAAKMVENIKVTVFDSKSVATPEIYMALKAAEMAKAESSVSEILVELEKIRDNHGIFVSVDTLRYLVKNGRLSGASGFMGSLLKIKPMLALTKEGKIEAAEKIRTRSKAISRMIERFLEENPDGTLEKVFLIHGNAFEDVKVVREKLLEALPSIKEIIDYPLTPVVGAHAGPNALALGWLKKV